MMESSNGFPESPMEQDDNPYPCKGCGEILEEGKAFELAGNRWHIDCFRCNTCGTLLDSDANLLLLGDGSLICNNCTYSCSACGNKIEDLAILTGDQAFCAACFRCRSCRKKIENLKYARTSQGIFCMECHESLMRRKKKSQKHGSSRHKHHREQASNNAMLLDKSLPSLPPSAVDKSTLSVETESTPSEGTSDTPTELPRISHKKPGTSRSSSYSSAPPDPPRISQKRPANSRSSSSKSGKREKSPVALEEDQKDECTLRSTAYGNKRKSAASERSNAEADGDDFFIPMTLDPNTAPGPSPLITNQNFDAHGSPLRPQKTETKLNSREYFDPKALNSTSRKTTQAYETSPESPRSASPRHSRHSSQPNSPHIAYQEIGRDPSFDVVENARKRKDQNLGNSSLAAIALEKPRDTPGSDPRSGLDGEVRNGKFLLQEVPKNKKTGASARSSKSDGISPSLDATIALSKSKSAPVSASIQVKEQQGILPSSGSPKRSRTDATTESSRAPQDSRSNGSGSNYPDNSHSSPPNSQLQTLPQRGDSLAKSTGAKNFTPRKEVGAGSSNILVTDLINVEDGNKPLSAPPAISTHRSAAAAANSNGNGATSKSPDSPSSGSNTEIPHPPLRRDRAVPATGSSSDTFVTPRAPPTPSMGNHKARNESISTLKSDSTRHADQPSSPKLPRYNAVGEFSMEEDMARILGNEEQQDHSSFLRRVSNSVRHARSYSDRGTRLSREPKWPKSPLVGSSGVSFNHEISSPTSSSPETKEELIWFKNELRRERQKCVEKDQRLLELEAALDAKSNIKQMNTELRDKRSTMVVLDTQKEIVIRELEVLTDHIAATKKSGEPLDLGKMSNMVLRDFAEALQKLKDTFAPQIEDLTQKRNELVEDVANLTQLKDKSFQDFEQLSLKNAQLADLNNQLVHQIQELYKANAGPSLDIVRPPLNGLGIYQGFLKDRSDASMDNRETRPSIVESSLTGSTIVHEHDAQPATLLAAPQVVNIAKPHQKKFNWKKGSQNVAKGVSKGLKGAFTSNDQNKFSRDGQYTEGMPYGSILQGQEYNGGGVSRNQVQDPSRQGFGFFGNQKQPKPVHWRANVNGSLPAVNGEDGPALFGSELEHRAEFERVGIPGIVMRCIQEVELRGMDLQGIYRKSGGNSQIQGIKEGFERSNDFDISEPELDINAVTSTLKQYLRKLPTPLITYDVYDKLLECSSATAPHNLTYHESQQRIEHMRVAINDLPPRHRDCLEVLVFHLARVVEREKENLMTSLNVAVVFAPTVMRPESLAREMSDTQAKNMAVQFLIENCQEVFLGRDRAGEGG